MSPTEAENRARKAAILRRVADRLDAETDGSIVANPPGRAMGTTAAMTVAAVGGGVAGVVLGQPSERLLLRGAGLLIASLVAGYMLHRHGLPKTAMAVVSAGTAVSLKIVEASFENRSQPTTDGANHATLSELSTNSGQEGTTP